MIITKSDLQILAKSFLKKINFIYWYSLDLHKEAISFPNANVMLILRSKYKSHSLIINIKVKVDIIK